MTGEKDYVLGTHDDELSRLGLQHRVWRPRASAAWQRAGFTTGQTLVDLGSGPGYASLDLAEIVGPSGRIVSIDRSRRFLDALESMAAARGIANITPFLIDLDEGELPAAEADGIWARWVFAFVKRPRDLAERAARLLKPGGTFVIHEYFDYSTWRMAPRCAELEEFVSAVTKSWRASGGEPDVGLDLPSWLTDAGLSIVRTAPIVLVAPRSSFIWEWPRAFIEVGLERLVDLGEVSRGEADRIRAGIRNAMDAPGALMITPGVLEIIASKS